jgi:hypothetical protein
MSPDEEQRSAALDFRALTQEERVEQRLRTLEERSQTSMPPMTTEDAEKFVGTLIRRLNPYTNIMHYPPGNPQQAERNAETLKSAQEMADRTDNAVIAKLAQYQFEVDNRYGSQNGGDYLSWEFKGQPQVVKKAVRIQFRHPSKNGGWITDHLLIGFAGSNGP